METVRFMLVAKRENSNEWRNTGEFALPVLPRIGEHVVVSGGIDLPLCAYRVVGILHPAPNEGLIDVLAVYDGDHGDVQDRLLSS